MEEYAREDACRDPALHLQIVWECDYCGHERQDYPGANEVGHCHHCFKGKYVKAGETSNGRGG